jgi:hypothetical protein
MVMLRLQRTISLNEAVKIPYKSCLLSCFPAEILIPIFVLSRACLPAKADYIKPCEKVNHQCFCRRYDK